MTILTLRGEETSFSEGTSTSFDIAALTEETFGCSTYRGFDGKPSFGTLIESAAGFARNYGGLSKKKGYYLHFRQFPNPEIAKCLLDVSNRWGNTCENITGVSIPKGVRIAFGAIAGASEIQIFFHPDDVDDLISAS
jgi:hypothetical protein